MRESAREQGRGRKRRRDSIPSRFRTVSTEPDTGLTLWSDWATQVQWFYTFYTLCKFHKCSYYLSPYTITIPFIIIPFAVPFIPSHEEEQHFYFDGLVLQCWRVWLCSQSEICQMFLQLFWSSIFPFSTNALIIQHHTHHIHILLSPYMSLKYYFSPYILSKYYLIII